VHTLSCCCTRKPKSYSGKLCLMTVISSTLTQVQHAETIYSKCCSLLRHTPTPMATPATQNIFTDNLHAPLCTAYNIVTASRRGSADDAEEVDSPRSRLTREQVFVLEKQFMENNKPTTAIRFSIAQKTGLSMQRVGVRFFLGLYLIRAQLLSPLGGFEELILTIFFILRRTGFRTAGSKQKYKKNCKLCRYLNQPADGG